MKIKLSKGMKILLVVLAAVITTATVLALLWRPTATAEEGMMAVKVYFLNPVTNEIEYEEHYLREEEDKAIQTGSLFQIIKDGPRSKSLVKTYPDNLEVVGMPKGVFDDAYIEVEFSKEYHDMTPTQELFFRTTFVWTLTELPFIDSVYIYVDGKKLLNSKGNIVGMMNRDNIRINPTISPSKTQIKEFTLYFANESGDGLLPELRSVNVSSDRETEAYIVEQLIEGPKEDGHYPTVAADIRVKDNVRTEDGTCYVNLSSDFLTKSPAGNCMEVTTIYSIVNSLTELNNVKRVKFLIESENASLYKGAIDLSKPLERDEGLIMASAVE